ncbi:ABC transporter permease [Urechidicola croceus]|uniref:ABC transporter permease n=1 Tax=Urechidicola croceus TaxID=1850246 RepID=A0A1D8P9Y3_9FLAO|nr:FtsX-like permease family protein [Urechidicola croceus]AOW21419.1 ABC transporter permease [Urechidicola croceus]
MNFPLYIAKRYLFSKSSNNTINIITAIATIGVIIGTMALFIVLSGFSGLKAFSLGFLKTSDPDFKISPVKGKSFQFTEQLQSIINNQKGIAQYTKVIEERAFFEFKNKTHLANIKGVEENYTKVNNVDTAIVVGNWINFDLPDNAVIGNGISNKLSMGINDYLEPLKIYVPKPGSGYVKSLDSDISLINVQPVGIFALTEELDRKFVFLPIELAQILLSYESNQISAIEVKVSDLNSRENIIEELQSSLGNDFKIQTREQLNAVFYKMLNTENLASYLIFTLILIIALFNVIGALIMMIFDKKNNLKTLYNLGTSVSEIRKIFVLQGFLLSFFGLLIGLLLGIVLVFSQQQFGFFMITQNLPFPVEFRFKNVLIVFFTILILGFIASKIASSRITKKVVE